MLFGTKRSDLFEEYSSSDDMAGYFLGWSDNKAIDVSAGATPIYFLPMEITFPRKWASVAAICNDTAPVFTGSGRMRVDLYHADPSDSRGRPGAPVGVAPCYIALSGSPTIYSAAAPDDWALLEPGHYWVSYQFENGFSAGNLWASFLTNPVVHSDGRYGFKTSSNFAFSAARPTITGGSGLTNETMQMKLFYRFERL